MTKKDIVTAREIEQDIANVLQNPANPSETSRKKYILIGVLIGILSVSTIIIFPWLLFIVIPLAVVLWVMLIRHLLGKPKNVHIKDYEVTADILSYKEHESYNIRGSQTTPTISVDVFRLFFESGRQWCLPTAKNYRWSERNAQQSDRIYDLAKQGDTFITVIEKKTGKIVVAYSTQFFVFK